MFHGFVAEHAREPENPVWAAKTKASLARDLEGIAKEAHFSRFELDCRSKTCTGFVEWPSAQEAHQNTGLLLHTQYGINSGVRFLYPQDMSATPCRVSVIFEPMDQNATMRLEDHMISRLEKDE